MRMSSVVHTTNLIMAAYVWLQEETLKNNGCSCVCLFNLVVYERSCSASERTVYEFETVHSSFR